MYNFILKDSARWIAAYDYVDVKMMTRYISNESPLLAREDIPYSTIPFIPLKNRNWLFNYFLDNNILKNYLPFKVRRLNNGNLSKFFIKPDFK